MKQNFPTAAPFLPRQLTLPALERAAENCEGCDLYIYATQTVFGAGSSKAKVMFVGEQPGDQEDKQGAPFVGPAGKLLDRALEEAGIPREETYVTNAVKHFKFVPRGKRRIHQKPRASEIAACRPWLESEMAVLRRRVVVCLGATAAQSLMGSKFRLTVERGRFFEHASGALITATIHPSALLRIEDSDERHSEFARFAGDLKLVAAKFAA